MAIKQGTEVAQNSKEEEIRRPLILQEKTLPDEDAEDPIHKNGHEWMVYLSTFVAVCGSFAFGSCVSAAF